MQSQFFAILLYFDLLTMKLTPELISWSESRISPLKDRELDLRGHKIPAIENLGVTRVSLAKEGGARKE
jgi:hypothetical protein